LIPVKFLMKEMAVRARNGNLRYLYNSFRLKNVLESVEASVGIYEVVLVVHEKIRFCDRANPEMMSSIRLQECSKPV